MNTTRAAAEAHSSGGVSPITRAAAGASASAPPTGFTFTPVLRGYESAAVGRFGLRGKEPQIEPRHGHGACPRTAKARPADAVPPPHFSISLAAIPSRTVSSWLSLRQRLTAKRPTQSSGGAERISRRAAIDNCCGGWRKLVPAFVGIEQPSWTMSTYCRSLVTPKGNCSSKTTTSSRKLTRTRITTRSACLMPWAITQWVLTKFSTVEMLMASSTVER